MHDFFKLNFDVIVSNTYMVAAAIITNHERVILSAIARRFPFINVNAGKAKAALSAVEGAAKLSSSSSILLEGDSLVTILALNSFSLDVEWSSAATIAETIFYFLFFHLGLQSKF